MNLHLRLLALVLIGCGGNGEGDGSGIDGDTPVIQLTADQRNALCDYAVEAAGPPRTVTCEQGSFTLGGWTTEECLLDVPDAIENPNCTATVAQYEACIDNGATYDPCVNLTPPACIEIFTTACYN